MKITYEVIKLKGQKHVKCATCGKWITRAMMFEQTLNPFNKNPDGTIKTREEIMKELRIKVLRWQNNTELYYCKYCDDPGLIEANRKATK